jgi:DNA-directed RNA polymerase I and III subunit RPAC2
MAETDADELSAARGERSQQPSQQQQQRRARVVGGGAARRGVPGAAEERRRVTAEHRVGISSATYVVKDEGHTLGNSLRNQLMKDPRVSLCGYTVPHPMESIIKMRLQTHSSHVHATTTLKDGLEAISKGMKLWTAKFEKAVEKKPIKEVPKFDINAFVQAQQEAAERDRVGMEEDDS